MDAIIETKSAKYDKYLEDKKVIDSAIDEYQDWIERRAHCERTYEQINKELESIPVYKNSEIKK